MRVGGVAGLSLREIRCICGFVVKEDALENHLTPYEILENSARLRLSYLSESDRNNRINQAIYTLRLKSIEKLKIKDFRSIYGSCLELQLRRRIMIANEMVRDCPVLVLEDPLFGMQYEQMVDIVCALKEVCKSGKIVIMTAEQPPLDIVNQFNQILLLHEGEELYMGNPTEMRSFFAQHKVVIPEISDPVDYLINLLNMSDETFSSVQRNLGFSDLGVYSKRTCLKLIEVIKDNQEREIAYSTQKNDTLVKKLVENGSSHRVSFLQGYFILQLKYTRIFWRNKSGFYLRIRLAIAALIFCSILFWDCGYDRPGI